ncbi:hypothetical protein HDV00_002781 [Rhizophlyctis rosea]|nr:hypothetical protein HDV00_002781 [Rhizophlyctis rosea]
MKAIFALSSILAVLGAAAAQRPSKGEAWTITDPTLSFKECAPTFRSNDPNHEDAIIPWWQSWYRAYEPGSTVFQIRRYEDAGNISAKYCVTYMGENQPAELHTCNLPQYQANQRFRESQINDYYLFFTPVANTKVDLRAVPSGGTYNAYIGTGTGNGIVEEFFFWRRP